MRAFRNLSLLSGVIQVGELFGLETFFAIRLDGHMILQVVFGREAEVA